MVVSSVDGKVVALEEVDECDVLGGRAIQLSVFMSVFNVHANWYPVDGKVEKVEHQHGRFRSAYLPKSSSENERSSIVIRTNGGTRILVRQIAGAIAHSRATDCRRHRATNRNLCASGVEGRHLGASRLHQIRFQS